jgi:hypothetical protein
MSNRYKQISLHNLIILKKVKKKKVGGGMENTRTLSNRMDHWEGKVGTRNKEPQVNIKDVVRSS